MAKVKDLDLAEKGEKNVYWARRQMKVLERIRERFKKERILEGVEIGACLHVTKETAVLMLTLRDAGASLTLCPSNPLSTQDDVAAFLASEGIDVYAWRGMSTQEYYWAIDQVLSKRPEFLMDDGADLIVEAHKRGYGFKGGTEETTTGVIRLKALEKENKLLAPVIAVNNARTKYLFDNRYGTGQSVIDGILRATNILLAGKNFVVAGYGWCGKGLARRAKGMGANVIVCEVDPVKALEAVMDGFRVMPMSEAAKIGDIFVTVTGCKDVIRKEHMLLMKDGAILANAGHFNVEVSVRDLEEISLGKRKIRENLEEYLLNNGKRIYLLAEGRLVNLAAAEGHPSEVMDMSFSNQALCLEYLLENHEELEKRVYNVPKMVDERVARLKLKVMGVSIDELTDEQRRYLSSWELGT